MDKVDREKGPWAKIVLDEIALEGLEGITIEGLWIRFEQALNTPNKTPEHFKVLIWEFLKKEESKIIEFYQLPHPKQKIKTFKRSDFIDPELGFPVLPDECPFNRPNYKSINQGSIRGSCEYFHERKIISSSEIEGVSLDQLKNKYGETFVIVASQEYRENVLFPEFSQKVGDLTSVQYCVLEAIGRSRYNGEVTAGRYSLNTYVKDYFDVFYIKVKLSSLQLIAKQPYMERLQNRISNGYLLTLPRYYRIYKTRPVILIETLYNVLNSIKSKTIELKNLKKNEVFEGVSFKKFSRIPIFMKHFEFKRVPYREIHPDAKVKKWKNSKSGLEKFLINIGFINPNITLEEIFDSTNNDGPEAESIEFLSDKHYFLDMSFQEQVYRFIAKHGSVGCNQMQITRYTAMSKYSVRQLIKGFLKMGYVKPYATDVGRQRVIMYVTYDQEKKVNDNKGSSTQEIIEDSKLDEENILKRMNEIDNLVELKREIQSEGLKLERISNVISVIKETQIPYNFAENKIICDPKTARHNQRLKLIVDVLNNQFFIERNILRKYMIAEEEKLGYKDQICSKSIYRIVRWLIDKKMARFYELNLKYNKYIRVIYYIAHTKLESHFKVLQNEILKQKYALLVTLEEQEIRQQTSTKTTTIAIQHKAVKETFAKSPRFLTARFIHEFLYFLVYEQDRNATPIKNYDKIEDLINESAPDYDLNCLEVDLSASCYVNDLNWRMFIRPLPIYKDKPSGWAYIMDIYLRLPLSIVVKMYQISKYSHPLFKEYVNDPIKQHYLISKLPAELQEILSHFRISRSFLSVLKIINWTGLIQMGHRPLKDSRESWLYVNRKAKIIDTTTTSPRYRYISLEHKYNSKCYTFNTALDVQNYWNSLCKICLSTKLGAKNDITRTKAQRSEIDFLDAVDFNEAMENDVGFIPGDNLGASGINSGLFSHLPRNWSWRAIKKKTSPKVTERTNKIRFNSTAAKMTIEKPVKLKPNTAILKLKQMKGIPLKKTKQVKPPVVPKKKGEYDKIDREALNKMSSLRVTWSEEEDRMLKICRAVYIYLSDSISQLQRAINSYTYRDILHWALNSVNKTSKACQRRLRYMMRNKPSLDVMTWLHELNQNPQINNRFGVKVLMNLRNAYKRDAEFINILKILFIKLVYYLNKIMKNSNEIATEFQTILPDTLNQFYCLYKEIITLNRSNDITHIRDFALKHSDPKNIEDIEISTINSIMHSTLCCTRDKTLYNIQIFEVYKKFKEEILAKAYKKARDDNLVVQLKFKSGASGSKLAPISGSSFVLSVKYKQQLYLDIPYEAVELCFRQFEMALQNFFCLSPTPFLIKTFDAGSFYHLLELIANDQVNVDIQLPPKILTVDPNQSTAGEADTERIMDHFHLLFDNAPRTEYVKYFEENSDNASSPRIKFNKTNESYKLIYNPYDILSKLPDDYYHFYCALDNINKVIDLDFSRFNMDTFCPFNCILKSSDLINTIERILNERKIIIEELLRKPEIEEIIESIVMLNQKNVMQVFERLQNALRERNLSNDQKDFGRLKIKRNKINILMLSKDILDYAEIDLENKLELESSNHKEDKNKSQDVFVVNLPTLKVTYKNIKIEDEPKEELVQYKNLEVPLRMVKNIIDRDEILQKVIGFSQWSHNGNLNSFFQSKIFKVLEIHEQKFTENFLRYLDKFELGATAEMILEHFKDEQLLIKVCSILRQHYLVMRVGVHNFIYVHKNHVTPWVVNSYNIKRLDKEFLQDSTVVIKSNSEKGKRSNDIHDADEPPSKKEVLDIGDGKRISKPKQQYNASTSEQAGKIKEHIVKEKESIIIRPFPWIRINGSLNRRVLDKWIGVVLSDCLLNSGQSVTSICERFNQLHPMNMRCLLEILEDLNCIKLKVLKKPTNITLFSSYENDIVEEEDATEFSEMDETFIVTLPNALVNLSTFIGEKKYGIDFI